MELATGKKMMYEYDNDNEMKGYLRISQHGVRCFPKDDIRRSSISLLSIHLAQYHLESWNLSVYPRPVLPVHQALSLWLALCA